MAESTIEIKSVGKDIEYIDKLVKEVVDVHLSAFPNFFLSTLGTGFLRTYYRCFVEHKNGNLIVATMDDKVVAFAAATSECRGFNTSLLKKNLFAFGCRFLVLLFTKPMAIVHLANNMTKTSEEVEDNEDYAELYSIGTIAVVQGKGIGTKLMERLEVRLKKQGVEKVSLTTDYVDNDATLSFYKKNGYEVLYEFLTYPNRKMYRLIKKI
ncbi:putative acetyltransferase [Bacteroides thetaiotaomicron]|uniref:GNAT family N-acetyltransferase n=1 Tax=Bacteroides thetaiotaomicron TaxID=818 RepID=UPI0006C1F134|nr:GNAT family N-acetyltransferase [Bacteroides thetaiotaomicron]MDC2165042.1 GNAT family N-acetyltransferase [Bacteroides thetaiotaomicron]CUN31380.1 putative acetyltransferase [Bacteroides thetaiotaomicron]